MTADTVALAMAFTAAGITASSTPRARDSSDGELDDDELTLDGEPGAEGLEIPILAPASLTQVRNSENNQLL